ncbi:pilus assembly protein TadG-related protein [Streptomyces sp. NPDC050315]|uniref:pilus assembly protein TadG-related protein n=1 Tax=Streptomyces sp. NPDC050315 TaxID=3155039 RepID=UPI00341EB9FB
MTLPAPRISRAALRTCRDSGQALPIYITVVAGLLFLAFAYFAVGQAAAARNGAQSAADAAALAAAQDARDQLREALIGSLQEPADWPVLLAGQRYDAIRACLAAGSFAQRNDAAVAGDGCLQLADDRQGFTVQVRTTGGMGASVIPGTENEQAEARATAVIEPKCALQPDEEPGGGGTGDESPKPEPGAGDQEPGAGDKDKDRDSRQLSLRCDGQEWSIDPEEPDPAHPGFPRAADLFSVKLAD